MLNNYNLLTNSTAMVLFNFPLTLKCEQYCFLIHSSNSNSKHSIAQPYSVLNCATTTICHPRRFYDIPTISSGLHNDDINHKTIYPQSPFITFVAYIQHLPQARFLFNGTQHIQTQIFACVDFVISCCTSTSSFRLCMLELGVNALDLVCMLRDVFTA